MQDNFDDTAFNHEDRSSTDRWVMAHVAWRAIHTVSS